MRKKEKLYKKNKIYKILVKKVQILKKVVKMKMKMILF